MNAKELLKYMEARRDSFLDVADEIDTWNESLECMTRIEELNHLIGVLKNENE